MQTQASDPVHQHLVLINALLALLCVPIAEETSTAYALAGHSRFTALQTTSASLVAFVNHSLIHEMHDEVLALGDAVLTTADLLTVFLDDAVLSAERLSTVDTTSGARLLTAKETAFNLTDTNHHPNAHMPAHPLSTTRTPEVYPLLAMSKPSGQATNLHMTACSVFKRRNLAKTQPR